MRLVRIDHRRITELLSRLDGYYRPDANLPARIASELSAHAYATTSELLPFAEVRVDKLDGRCRDGLDSLVEIAAEFDRSAEPIPAERAHHAITTFREHVDAEEEDMLQPLEATVPVPRLRTAGDAFRRARDTAFKSRGEQPTRYWRPITSRAELYEQARRRGVSGRSTMTRAQLRTALQDTA